MTSRRKSASPGPQTRPVALSLQEYGRGIAGGLIFSLPLLYTMEMWWAGVTTSSARLLAAVGGTLLLLLGYNFYAGLRHDADFAEVAIDSVEELGIGIALSTAMLFLLGRIPDTASFHEAVGKIVTEALTVAIGVSVGTAQLGGEEDGDTGVGGRKHRGAPDQRTHAHAQLVTGLCGAVLFAANIGPTDEVEIIGASMSGLQLAGLVLVSMGVGGVILFYSEFRGSRVFSPAGEHLGAIMGTVAMYGVAAIAAAAILWFFGRFDEAGARQAIAQTIVLAFPASLGASAGRLLLQ